MARKKRRQKESPDPPCFVFTLEMVSIASAALLCLEEPLRRANPQDGKIVFATETMTQVKCKLDAMCTSLGHMLLTSFDYNEKVVIATAIQLYMLELLARPLTAQRERMLRQCRQIEHFALDDLQIELPRPRTRQDEK